VSPYVTGRGDRGGGDTVGAWRPRALAPQTVMIDKERWFSSHTLVTSRERGDPLDRDDPWEGHVPEGDLHAWRVRKAGNSQGG